MSPDAAAFDRAVGVLAAPPGWLRAAVDGEAVRRILRRGATGPAGPGEPGGSGPAGPGWGPGLVLDDVPPGEVVGCEALDVRLTGDGWRGWYAVTLRGPDGTTRRVEVAGHLHPPVGAPVDGPGGAATVHGHLRRVPDGGDLPALAVLTDPAGAAALLERVLGGPDGVRPGYRVAGCTPRVVRHARGARITVVLQVDPPPDPGPPAAPVVVAKGYRDDAGAATHAAMTALWRSRLRGSDAVAIARPLGWAPDLRVLLQGPVPDAGSLTDLVVAAVADGSPAALDRLHAALRRTADGLVALHGSGVAAAPPRTPDALAGRVRRAARRLGDALPGAAATADGLVGPLLDRAGRLPADPAVPSHGGFRPAQVLLDAEDRPGFVDFDGFCRAEPAFDLGRFRARLREIALAAPGGTDRPLSAGRRRLADALADTVLDRYAASARVSRGRVAVWEDLELVTALVQSWTRGQLTRTAPLAVLLGADPPTGPDGS